MISVRPYSNFDILKILSHDWLLFWSAAENCITKPQKSSVDTEGNL